MPFEKKKKYKTASDYRQKSIYLDENDPYQAECLLLLTLCGHKQSKFLGLLAHDFIQRNGINIENLDKDIFKDYIKILELQIKTGINNPFAPAVNLMQAITAPAQGQVPMPSKDNKITEIPKRMDESIDEDEFISEEDMDDMNAALKAFGA